MLWRSSLLPVLLLVLFDGSFGCGGTVSDRGSGPGSTPGGSGGSPPAAGGSVATPPSAGGGGTTGQAGTTDSGGDVPPVVMTSTPAPCREPLQPGSTCGSPGGTRYFFDESAKDCAPFAYGGCGGNENNFSELKGCWYFCKLQVDCACTSSTANCAVTRECLDCPGVIFVKETTGTHCSVVGLECHYGPAFCTCVTAADGGGGVWRCDTPV
jgi:hypothetical protein